MHGVELHVPRGHFYSPKGPRIHWSSIWKTLVASCSRVHRTIRCTLDSEQCNDYEILDWLIFCFGGTKLSGAPVDHWPLADVAASRWRLAHWTVRRLTWMVRLIIADAG
jgi:hypothetical protein